MAGWWVTNALQLGGPALLVSWVFWVIVSIVLHELSHGWAALRAGDPTPEVTGHMTWNPVVHMGSMSLIAFALIGIAWGAMPVDPSRMRGRHAEALVALAGPAMNLLLFAVATIGGVLWIAIGGGYWFAGVQAPEPLFSNLQAFFSTGAFLNLVLMLFNLLPVPPLDGSRIAAHYSRAYRDLFSSEQGQWIGLGLFIFVFLFGFDRIFGAAIGIAGAARVGLLSVLAPGAV